MRLLTKAAVGVGVVLIGAGVWIVNRDPGGTAGPGQQVADNTQTPAAPAGEQPAPLEQPAEPPKADAGGERSSHEASPAPRNVDTGIGHAAADDHRTFRPQPSITPEPPRLILPNERTGLAGTSLGPKPHEETDIAPSPAPIETVTDAPKADDSAQAAAPAHEEPKKEVALPAPPAPTVAEKPASPTPAIALPTTRPEAADAKVHVIQSGDTFSSLAIRYYGHAKHASLIVKANPDKDPRRLLVGAKINIPPGPQAAPAPAKAADSTPAKPAVTTPIAKLAPSPAGAAASASTRPATASGRTYTVRAGEGWYDLAQRFLGKGTDWPELYEYNKELVSNNPSLLRAGTTIELPEHARLPEPQ